MRRYIEHIISTREPHERRQHAVRVASVFTLGLFALWLGTLSLRLGNIAASQESGDGSDSLTASAAAAQAQSSPHLEVSTTSVLQ